MSQYWHKLELLHSFIRYNMESSRFKAIFVSTGISLWFFIITTALGIFTIEIFVIFSSLIFIVTQIFTKRISKYLEIIGIANTKIFLTILFTFVISIYGILFRALRIDLFRTKEQNSTYWLEMERFKVEQIRKQY